MNANIIAMTQGANVANYKLLLTNYWPIKLEINGQMQRVLKVDNNQQILLIHKQCQLFQPPTAAVVPLLVVQNLQGNPYTIEKFIKNGANVFKGTTDPKKAAAQTMNMLKSFRVIEFPEALRVRLVSFMSEDVAAFWWDLQ